MTSNTDPTLTLDPVPPVPTPQMPGTATGNGGHRRRNLIIAAVVAAVLILGGVIGGVVAARASTAKKLDDATAEYTQIVSDLKAGQATAEAALSAAAVTNLSSIEKLGGIENPMLVALTDAVDAGYRAVEDIGGLPDPRAVDFADLAEADAAVAEAQRVRDEVTQSQEAVAVAVADVEAAVKEAELAAAVEAHTGALGSITTQITDAEALLAASEGKADEVYRQGLAGVLDEARAVRDEVIDATDLEALTAHTGRITTVSGKFSGPIGNIQYSIDTWNQARDAEAQKTTPRSNNTNSGTGGGSNNAGTGTKPQGTTKPQGGGTTPQGGGGSGGSGGTWTETEEGTMPQLCFDSDGNTYSC